MCLLIQNGALDPSMQSLLILERTVHLRAIKLNDNQLGSPEQDATQVLSNLVFDWSPQSWVCQISQLYLETFHLEPIIH